MKTNAKKQPRRTAPEPVEDNNQTTLSYEGVSVGTSRVVDVTPAIAEKWLAKNHEDNRAVVWHRVEAFANDMRAGAWKLTHQGVAFDEEGRLIDGQHRLQAVVHAGVTVRMLVLRGVGEFGDPIDCGRPRSIALLSGYGTKQTGAINTLRMLEQGCRLVVPMTLNEAQEVYGHHAEGFGGVPHAGKMAAGILGAAVYAFPIHGGKVTDFVQKYVTGEMIKRGDPAYALRTWKDRQGFSRDSWSMAMATLNCIRHHIQGENLAAVYTGPMGYRVLTGRRRALKIPFTPNVDLVSQE